MSTIKVNAIQHTTANASNMTLFANGNVAMTTANTTLTVGSTTISNSGISVGGNAINPLATGMRNRIINGAMVIDQRNSGATVTPATNAYTLDRWRFATDVASKFTITQEVIAAPQSCEGNRFTLSAKTAAAFTPAAGNYFGINQFIEAHNTGDLAWGTSAAKTVTLSFWVYCGLTGTFGGAIRTGDSSNYSYPFTYTISSANTWEKKTIIIPGPTAGTWNRTNNSAGIDVWFSLGVGSTYQATANTWAAANYVSPTGCVNVVSTASASGGNWYITGVQLEEGTVATPFEWRHYGQELALCQRYYQKSYAQGTVPNTVTAGNCVGGVAASTTYMPVSCSLPVVMRATPGFTIISASGTNNYISAAGNVDRGGSFGVDQPGDSRILAVTGAAVLTAGTFYYFHFTASAEL